LKPKLKVDYSWGEVMVMPVEDHPNTYILALVDFFPGFRTTLPEGKQSLDSVDKPLDFTGGEIASAKRLTFKSQKDYVIDSPPVSSRVMKIMLENSGYVTAHRINIGIHCSEDSRSTIIPSANINVSEETIAASGVNPSFSKIAIDRLGASEKALLTVACGPDGKSRPSSIGSPFIKISQNLRYAPVLYVNSEEGRAEISPHGISWKDAMAWEEFNFPNSVIGFWASRIHPKKGISPSIEDMKELEIDYELVEDETGKHTGNGTLRINPSHK
jgi:hypothetical protein